MTAAAAVAVALLIAQPVQAATAPRAAAQASDASSSRTVSVSRTLGREEVDGVTYRAIGTHRFSVRVSASGPPTLVAAYDPILTVSARPAARSVLTVVSKDAEPSRFSTGVHRVKVGRTYRKVAYLKVTTTFRGVVVTKWGNRYSQEATMSTVVDRYDRTTTVERSPVVLRAATDAGIK